jgi:hypothetical protein
VKEMTVMNLIISRKRVTLYNSILGSQNNSAFQKGALCPRAFSRLSPLFTMNASLYKFPLSRRLKPPHIITDS